MLPGRPVPDPGADQPADRGGGDREHDAGGRAGAHRGDRRAARRRGPAPAHRRAVPRRINGAGHARRPDRNLHRRRDRSDLRGRQGLDRRAEPGLHPARPAHRHRRRPARGRVSGAARSADEPAGRPEAHVNRGMPMPGHGWKGTMMRTRTGWSLLICCAVLTACTAAPKGPDANVTTPAVGRPPAPASVAAAMSSEAFTPYAALGAADNDGLAPGDTYDALHTACMNDAGYGQYAAQAAYFVRANSGMGFPQAYGPWGYVGTAQAAQEGFMTGNSLPAQNGHSGPGAPGAPGGPFGNLP